MAYQQEDRMLPGLDHPEMHQLEGESDTSGSTCCCHGACRLSKNILCPIDFGIQQLQCISVQNAKYNGKAKDEDCNEVAKRAFPALRSLVTRRV